MHVQSVMLIGFVCSCGIEKVNINNLLIRLAVLAWLFVYELVMFDLIKVLR